MEQQEMLKTKLKELEERLLETNELIDLQLERLYKDETKREEIKNLHRKMKIEFIKDMENYTKLNSQELLTSMKNYKENLENGNRYYAEGKGFFYAKDKKNAVTYFQLARDQYKEIIKNQLIDESTRKKIKNKIDKTKIEGKYSPLKI